MNATCLSVPSPRSYLICAGIADVENRGFATDYRGSLYIHSSGRHSYSGMPDMSEYPVPVIQEFNAMLAQIQEIDQSGRFISIPDGGVRVELRDEADQTAQAIAEYSLLADVYAAYHRDPHAPFFHVQAIIGRVDLVDVITDSSSPWAEPGYTHWILENAVLFEKPITGIRTSRTRLWEIELPD